MKNRLRIWLICSILCYIILSPTCNYQVVQAENDVDSRDSRCLNIGNPVITEVWVDPVKGNDKNSGIKRDGALQTLAEAWDRIPANSVLIDKGYCILLAPGDYTEEFLPPNGWMEGRYGASKFPIIIKAADGPKSARIHGYLNICDCRYLYLIGLDFVTDKGFGDGGNVVHIEKGNHILIRDCKLNGNDGEKNQPQETLKINQSQYVYIEDNDISGAFWFSLDFVAVQHGHIQGNRIHNSGDDCLLLKGGSADFRIEGNEIYDCGNVGFAAGQGTGFEFMVTPWIHYELYDVKFINNIIYNAQNAGVAVRGGYNILLAQNTLYNIGLNNGSPLLLLSPGMRSCDGNTVECKKRNKAGGWGPTSGDAGECIPNRNVYVYNNIFYNKAPLKTEWSHFTVFGPRTPPTETNIQSPVLLDDNLQIRGNLIWNGPTDQPLGVEEEDQGGQPSNPTCNAIQLRKDNKINIFEPQLINPGANDFRPVKNGNIQQFKIYDIPDFQGDDQPKKPLVPLGELHNSVIYDFEGSLRVKPGTAGAF